MSEIQAKIDSVVKSNDIVLFMKGDKKMPACGFSATALEILNRLNADYEVINILLDEEIRAAVKIYSDWPTYPQLYIKGEFIGGCDIMIEMFESGELETFLKEKSLI